MRKFVQFEWKKANYRICSDRMETVKQTIATQRALLEDYIEEHRRFADSLVPVQLTADAPPIAWEMHKAARLTGLGPMAAVAGAIAQAACERAIEDGAGEAIVENGGDIFLISNREIHIGIYTGRNVLRNRLAFKVTPDWFPLAICSSSSRMGHSLSFGNCDLACIVAKNGSLADSVATLACNSVKKPEDIDIVINIIMEIPGILGVLITEQDKIGLAGKLPEIVKNLDPDANKKITHDPVYLF